MQFKTFLISCSSPELSEGEANKFLRSHRVLRTETHFVAEGCYWALLVEYADGDPVGTVPPARRGEKKDYSKELKPAELARYEAMRQRRNDLSKRLGVPPYVIFTNDELASLAVPPVLNAETVADVKGVAPARLRDYVAQFYDLTPLDSDEKGGASDRADSADR